MKMYHETISIISWWMKWASNLALGVVFVVALFNINAENTWIAPCAIFAFIGLISSFFIGGFGKIVEFCEKSLKDKE